VYRLQKKSPDDPPHGSIDVIGTHGGRFRRVPEMKPPLLLKTPSPLTATVENLCTTRFGYFSAIDRVPRPLHVVRSTIQAGWKSTGFAGRQNPETTACKSPHKHCGSLIDLPAWAEVVGFHSTSALSSVLQKSPPEKSTV
jgi:hypothetical protein